MLAIARCSNAGMARVGAARKAQNIQKGTWFLKKCWLFRQNIWYNHVFFVKNLSHFFETFRKLSQKFDNSVNGLFGLVYTVRETP